MMITPKNSVLLSATLLGLTAFFAGLSARATAGEGSSGTRGGGSFVITADHRIRWGGHVEEAAPLATPETLRKLGEKIEAELKRAQHLMLSLGVSSEFFDRQVYNPDIEYYFQATPDFLRNAQVDCPGEFPAAAAGVESVPGDCTVGKHTFFDWSYLKQLLDDSSADRYGIVASILHARLHGLPARVPRMFWKPVEDGVRLLLQLDDEQRAGSYRELTAADFRALNEFLHSIRRFEIGSLPTGYTLANGGGLVDGIAEVSPGAFIGVGSRVVGHVVVDRGAVILDSYLDGDNSCASIAEGTRVQRSQVTIDGKTPNVPRRDDSGRFFCATVGPGSPGLSRIGPRATLSDSRVRASQLRIGVATLEGAKAIVVENSSVKGQVQATPISLWIEDEAVIRDSELIATVSIHIGRGVLIAGQRPAKSPALHLAGTRLEFREGSRVEGRVWAYAETLELAEGAVLEGKQAETRLSMDSLHVRAGAAVRDSRIDFWRSVELGAETVVERASLLALQRTGPNLVRPDFEMGRHASLRNLAKSRIWGLNRQLNIRAEQDLDFRDQPLCPEETSGFLFSRNLILDPSPAELRKRCGRVVEWEQAASDWRTLWELRGFRTME